ncbi:MAG: hypothetical protein ACYTGL_27310 [Planctomycetota bacterium]|jgi:hypothetical protein
MSCCDPCNCIATVRVRQLVNADHSFDLLLEQQPSVRQQDEVWYFGTNRVLRNYGCRWSGTATIDEETRYEVRIWNAAAKQPLLTLAPLDDGGRPLCLHVFSSLSDPHDDYASPPPHQWSVDVIDEGSDVFRIEFRGQHLGYPVPLTLVSADHEPADVNRDEKLELVTFAQPGQPQVYRLTKALGLDDEPLSLLLEPWSGAPFPLTISADATAADIRYAIAPNQMVKHALPGGGATTESPSLYLSRDADNLSLTIAAPALSATELPDGETITFSIWQATQPDFSDEVALYADVLVLSGFSGSGTPALSATTALAGVGTRYVRVKATASSGVAAPTVAAVVTLTGAQSLPPISAECGRGVVDLYGYAETLGDASHGPQIDWSALTIWLTFHQVETAPARLRNDPHSVSWPSPETQETALFHTDGRLYVWPVDPPGAEFDIEYRLNDSDRPDLEPPWYTRDLTGGRLEHGFLRIWIDEGQNLRMGLHPYVELTHEAIVLKLQATELSRDAFGYVWFEYRSTEPPDLISGGDYTLTFAGVFSQSAADDASLPVMNPIHPAVTGVPLNAAVNAAGDSLHLNEVTFRCAIVDPGGSHYGSATAETGYTLIADGWVGGDTEHASVDDLNGTHLLQGTELGNLWPDPWYRIAQGIVADGVEYEIWNEFVEIQPQHRFYTFGGAPIQGHTAYSATNPVRQILVVHVDGQHYCYRPQTRAIVSDDPDELLFEIDPNPPALTWPGTGIVNVTSQPSEITVRVGPALLGNHCPECVENQQPTPMAFELTVPGITATDEPISLLRRADSMWAAHVPGVKPHWLPDGDPLLPAPLHDQLWILDGLETLRLYEVPVNGGDRRPVALYRFRPIEHPQPAKRVDDPETDGVNETFLGWQKSSLDCVNERELTLWMFGQGYDPARHLLPSAVNLKPIGRQCVYGSADYDWQHYLNRWDSDAGNSGERPPDDFGLPKIDIIRPDSENRTVCLGYDGTDAGIIWIDDVERWRVFATSCGRFQLPSIPVDPDNGEPGEIRRIKCYEPDPPDPPVSPCRWISNDGVTWEQIDPAPDEACSEGHECREPWFAPQFVGDVANGYCEPASCLGGESEWVWLQITPTFGKWYWQSDTCPDWCDALAPGVGGLHLEVAKGTCWCPTCT